MSLAHSIIKNTFWLGMAQAVQMTLLAFAGILLARYLGNVSYGKFVFAISFTNLFAVLADFGFTNFLINEIARDKSRLKQYLSNILGLKIIIAILYFLFIALIINLSGKPQEIKLFVYLATFSLIFNSFAMVFYAIFRAYEQMKYEAIFTSSLASLNFILIISAIFLRLDLFWIFKINLFVSAFGFLLVLFFVRQKFAIFKLEKNLVLWKNLLKNVLPFALSAVFISIYYYMDQVMLSFMKGDQVTGWYGAIYKILLVLISIVGVYFGVFFPVVSRLYKKDKQKLELLLRATVKLSFTLALPVTLGITILAHPIVLFIFGKEFLGGVLALQILIWTIFLISICGVYANSLLACFQKKIFTIGVGLGALVNILFNILLIPKFSLEGAAAATVLAEISIFIYMYHYFSKKLFKLNFIPYLSKPFLAVIIMGIVVYFLKDWNLFLTILLGAGIYSLIFLLIKGIKKEELVFTKEAIWPKK